MIYEAININITEFDLEHNTRSLIVELINDLRNKNYQEDSYISIYGNFEKINLQFSEIESMIIKSDVIKISYYDKEIDLSSGTAIFKQNDSIGGSILINNKDISCINISN